MKLKDVTHLRPQVLSAAMSFVPGHLFFSCQNVISGFFGNASITNKQTKNRIKVKISVQQVQFLLHDKSYTQNDPSLLFHESDRHMNESQHVFEAV